MIPNTNGHNGTATVSSGLLPSYEELQPTIEKLVAMKMARWKFPGMEPDDIAQEVRILCFLALQKYDPLKEGKGVFYFLAKCVDNGLYNKGRGIYFDNNPPCVRCPDYNRETKECCGSQRKKDYDMRMARRRAIDNPVSLNGSDGSKENEDTSSSFEFTTAVGSATGLVDLDAHIRDHLEPQLVPHYEALASGDASTVPMSARRQVREAIKEMMEK